MKIQANLAQFSSKNSKRKGKERSQGGWNMQSSFHTGETNTAGASEPAREQGRNDSLCSGTAGWLVEEGEGKGVSVAPWVVKEQKKSLYNSLVGFLKSKSEGIEQIESWIQKCCGQLPLIVQKLDEQVIWMQFSSSNEIEETLFRIQ